MEDGASWVVREEGSFWVYVKPAAHYNFLEWRFKQNVRAEKMHMMMLWDVCRGVEEEFGCNLCFEMWMM